jgi:NAD(P)-dependent dehydrogenase (short-subunit alcohol dehydrogenase family)
LGYGPPVSIDFSGKVALVTGAGTGIGRGTALVLARYGAAVAVSGRREAEIAETVALVEAAGGRALPVVCDVSNENDVRAMVAATVDQLGGLDIAVNNAGTLGRLGPIRELSGDDFELTIGTNQRGVFLCLVHELRAMAGSGGAIVNISSVNATVPEPEAALYCSSKAAIDMMTRVAAVEAAPAVRVNGIRPGFVLTPMHDAALDAMGGETPELVATVEGMVPLGRRAEPEEIGEAVAWLCSPDASYVTGEVITVDGGVTWSLSG